MSFERSVFVADALEWMAQNPAPPHTSVITSLPDVSELSELGLLGWKRWFVLAARQVIRWVSEDGVSIFFASDVRHDGEWIDKSYLLLRAAEEEQAHLVWHKIVCRRPPGTIAQGRPSYSHMLCVSRHARPAPLRPGPDVLPDAGFMGWSRAMGMAACQVACRFLRDETATRVVADPFCGTGAALAMANHYGFAAVGVDRSPKRCRAARTCVVPLPP
jgi:hypothetical protein